MNLFEVLSVCVSRLILAYIDILIWGKEEPFGGNFKGGEIQGDSLIQKTREAVHWTEEKILSIAYSFCIVHNDSYSGAWKKENKNSKTLPPKSLSCS